MNSCWNVDDQQWRISIKFTSRVQHLCQRIWKDMRISIKFCKRMGYRVRKGRPHFVADQVINFFIKYFLFFPHTFMHMVMPVQEFWIAINSRGKTPNKVIQFWNCLMHNYPPYILILCPYYIITPKSHGVHTTIEDRMINHGRSVKVLGQINELSTLQHYSYKWEFVEYGR